MFLERHRSKMQNLAQMVGFFALVTFLLSALLDFPLFTPEPLSASPGPFLWLVMWCPGIAAIITILVFRLPLKSLGLGIGKPRFHIMGIAWAILFLTAIYTGAWALRLCDLTPVALRGQWLTLLLLFPGKFGRALGEELGWRGFLFPRLRQRFAFPAATLITGILWALWHFPSILQGDYLNASSLPRGIAVVAFTVGIVGNSFAYSWLRERSSSVWPAVFLHATFNWFSQSVLEPIVRPGALTHYAVGEMSLGFAVAGVLVAALFWKRGELGTLPRMIPAAGLPEQVP